MGKSRWNKHNPLGAPSPSPTATSAWVWTMSAPCLAWRSQMPGPWKQGCCFHGAGNCLDFSFFFFKHGSFWKVHGTMGRNRDQENIPDFINWGVSLYPLGVWNWKTNTIDSSVHVITVSWIGWKLKQLKRSVLRAVDQIHATAIPLLCPTLDSKTLPQTFWQQNFQNFWSTLSHASVSNRVTIGNS